MKISRIGNMRILYMLTSCTFHPLRSRVKTARKITRREITVLGEIVNIH